MRKLEQLTDSDCVATTLACFLDLDYEDVPAINYEESDNREFWEHYNQVVGKYGKFLLFLRESWGEKLPDKGRWIAIVPSRNYPGETHVIIMDGKELWWDCAPEGKKYPEAPKDIDAGFLIIDQELIYNNHIGMEEYGKTRVGT